MRKLRNILIILSILLLAVPALAQDYSSPVVIDMGMNEIIATFTGLVISIVLLGLLWITRDAVQALGISIPKSALDSLGSTALTYAERKLVDTETAVKASKTLTDDLIFSIARIPVEALLGELRNRGITIPDPVDKVPPFVPTLDTPLNTNPLLIDGVTSTTWPEGRAKDVPRGYDLDWYKITPDDPYAPPPEIHIKSEYAGMKIELSDRRGILRISQHDNNIRAGQRYLLIVHGTTTLNLKPQATSTLLRFEGRLLNGEQILKPLRTWDIDTPEGAFAAQWPLQSLKDYPALSYELDLMIGNRDNVPFGDQSAITIHDIELKPVDQDYGTNALITF